MNHRGMSTCGGAEITGMNYADNTIKGILQAIASTRAWTGKEKKGGYKRSAPGWGRAFYVMSYAYNRKREMENKGRSLKGAEKINRFAVYVEKHKLGTCIVGEDNTNPVHSHNTILRPAIFCPDMSAVFDHIIKKKYYRKGAQRAMYGHL